MGSTSKNCTSDLHLPHVFAQRLSLMSQSFSQLPQPLCCLHVKPSLVGVSWQSTLLTSGKLPFMDEVVNAEGPIVKGNWAPMFWVVSRMSSTVVSMVSPANDVKAILYGPVSNSPLSVQKLNSCLSNDLPLIETLLRGYRLFEK